MPFPPLVLRCSSGRAIAPAACFINAAGEIVGIAIDNSGDFHGYLAVPNNASHT